MSAYPPQSVRRRQITENDLDAVADLLTAGFPERGRAYWGAGLARLAARPPIEGCPRFGYMLEAEGVAVGVIILIFTAFGDEPEARIRCNISSWYVAPAFRAYADELSAIALKLKHVTYLNISPAEHTWPLLTAQGYRRYTEGQFACIPLLSRRGTPTRVHTNMASPFLKRLAERDLLAAHAEAGCLSLVCESEGRLDPFVLAPRRVTASPVGLMQLIYCRDTTDFVRRAGALGRFLLKRGVGGVILDANAPVPGLVGRYFKGRQPKYFKGANRPRLNDLAFTETALFGA
jgi:hypothetical protein